MEALPFSTIRQSIIIEGLTGKAHRVLEGLLELGPHFDDEVSFILKAGLSVFGGIFNHLFKPLSVDGIHDVREPLAVHV
ncbi:MAG: hypothetical protein ACKO7B_09810, partial [Flavobacteriales bacterium]